MSPSAGVMRAMTSAVPTCTRIRERCVSGRVPSRSFTRTSTARLALQVGSQTTTFPRPAWFLSTPTRASAVRRPGSARGALRPCTSTPRTRDATSAGSIFTSSPGVTVPAHVVPVTTVPAPATLNARSIGMRNKSAVVRSTALPAAVSRPSRISSSPCPVLTDTGRGTSHEISPSPPLS